jgi:hypothetical protein
VLPFFVSVNANHPAVLQIPFHLIIESVVFSKTLTFVGLCRVSVVNPSPSLRDAVRQNSVPLVVFRNPVRKRCPPYSAHLVATV